MKRICGALCVLLTLSLCSCGAKSVPTPGSAGPSEPVPAPTPVSEPAAIEQPQEQVPQSPAATFSEESQVFENEAGELLLTVEVTHTHLTLDSQKALAAIEQVLQDWESRMSQADELRDIAVTELEWRRATQEGMLYWGGLYQGYQVQPARLDQAVVSLQQLGSNYTGGAHGSAWMGGLTFDTQTGEQLTLETLAAEGKDLREFCRQQVLAQLANPPEEILYWEDSANYIDDIVREEYWYLDDQGLSFVAQQYLVGPYAMGMPVFTVPYAQLTEVMDVRYLPQKEEPTAATPQIDYLERVDVDAFAHRYEVYPEAEGGVAVWFDAEAQQVRLMQVNYVPIGTEGEYGFEEGDILFAAWRMEEDAVLCIHQEIPEGYPNLKLCWVSDGVEQERYFAWSGQTGEALLSEES